MDNLRFECETHTECALSLAADDGEGRGHVDLLITDDHGFGHIALTPAAARLLAAALIERADEAERNAMEDPL